jgi:AcrR family transcriptional regulator
MAAKGRPRSFDAEQVLVRIQEYFWRSGYDDTSLSDLAAAARLHKPSLYAAFGDKHALYLKTLAAYHAQAALELSSALDRPRLRDALTDFFDADLRLFLKDGGRGCFMLETAVPISIRYDSLRLQIRDALEVLRKALVNRIEQAAKEPEFTPCLDAALAAELIVSTHIALSARARSGEAVATLRRTGVAVIDLICGAGN